MTYGLSELDTKESDDRSLSGWGFELTFRLAAGADDPEPVWAVDLLTNLAAYVWTSGHAFSPGHHLDLRGPIRIGAGSELTAAVIVLDPGLGAMTGPFGVVEFFQVVALTADELELCRSWSTTGVVGLLAGRDPLLVTRLDRRCIASEAAAAAEAARPGSDGARDGAGTRGGRGDALTELRVGSLRWRTPPVGRTVAQLGAGAAAALGPALRRTLAGSGDGASFSVIGDNCEVCFVTAEVATWRVEGARLEVAVPPDELDGLAALFDGRTGWGQRPAWSGLRWRVNP